ALGDEVRVTVIAAGFDGGAPQRSEIGTVRRPQPGIPTPPPRPDDGEAAVVSDGAAGTTGADGDTDARGGGSGDTSASGQPETSGSSAGATGAGSASAPIEPRRPSPPSSDDLDVPDFLK